MSSIALRPVLPSIAGSWRSRLIMAVPTLVAFGVLVGRFSWFGLVVGLAPLLLVAMLMFDGLPLAVYLFLYGILPALSVSVLGVSKVLTAACLLAWLLGVLMRNHTLLSRPTFADAAVVIYFAVSILSIVTITRTSRGTHLLLYLSNAGLYLYARSVAESPRALLLALRGFAAGTGLATLIALWSFTHGYRVSSENLSRLSLPGIGINDLSSIFLAGGAVALMLAAGARTAIERAVFSGVASLALVDIVLSRSRGDFVGVLVLLAVGLLMAPRAKARLLFVLVAIGIGLLFVPQVARAFGVADFQGRQLDLLTGTHGLDTSRPYLWRMALTAFREHPFVGLGVANFTVPTVWFTEAFHTHVPVWLLGPNDAHSFYLGALADVGLLGMVPLAFAFLVAGRFAFGLVIHERQNAFSRDRIVAAAICISWMAYFAAIFFLPVQNLSLPYILLALVIGLNARQSEVALASAVPEREGPEPAVQGPPLPHDDPGSRASDATGLSRRLTPYVPHP